MANQENYITTENYNYIQTFYVDPARVNNAGSVALTTVELYFKWSEAIPGLFSGSSNPGVSIAICEVENNSPRLTKCYAKSKVRLPLQVIAFDNDAAAATVFKFPEPVKLQTDKFYGIVVTTEDPAFTLWTSVSGDKIVNTTKTIATRPNTVRDGQLYIRGTRSADVFTSVSGADLKFSLYAAEYQSQTFNEDFINRDYEFFTISGRSGRFLTGEYVYQNTANATGTVAVTAGSTQVVGTGTSFETHAIGTPVVVYGNSTAQEVFSVVDVANNTQMTLSAPVPFTNSVSKYKSTIIGRVIYKDDYLDKLYLVDSSANSSVATAKFGTGNSVVGIDSWASATIASIDAVSVDRIRVKGGITAPPGSSIDTKFTAAYKAGGTYGFNASIADPIQINQREVSDVTAYDAYVLSRSLEVDNVNLYSDKRKSIRLTANLAMDSIAGTSKMYEAPAIQRNKIDIFTVQNIVSNTYTTTSANASSRDYQVVYDTEVDPASGTALSKHIGKKVTFAVDRYAEDVRVYMSAYRPLGSDIKVYARVHNSADPESFDDKAWSPLEYKTNALNYSALNDNKDFIEYEFGLPRYSETANSVAGSANSSLNSSTLSIRGANAANYLQTSDIVKIYNPIIPQNYMVAVVNSVSTTGDSVVLKSPVTNNNLVGTDLKIDRLKYPYAAFNNYLNDNVARYYSESLVEFDKFDTMQIKIVFLAESSYVVPRVDRIQVIGVSS